MRFKTDTLQKNRDMKKKIKVIPVSEETHDRIKDLTTAPDGRKGKSFDEVIRELLASVGLGKKNPE